MAKFNYINLDDETRNLMLQEINADIGKGVLYLSDRLNDLGKEKYKLYLIDAVASKDEEELEKILDIVIHFNPTYLRQGKSVKMPTNASTILSQSEFNRYYIRAICLKAISNDIEQIEIYRARESGWSRSESEAKIGTFISAKDLLEDLRNSIGTEPKLFPEINSGLCIKL